MSSSPISTNLSVPAAREVRDLRIGALASKKDRKVKNHVAMIPDQGFTKQLKLIDQDLEVLWDMGTDRWEIWCFPAFGEPYHVTTVQTKDRTYKQLSADVLMSLKWSYDLGPKKILAYLEEQEAQEARRKAKERKDKIDSITREFVDNFRGVIKIQVPRSLRISRGVREDAAA